MAGGRGPFPISLYPYVTLNSVIFGVALLLFYWLALYGVQRRSPVHVLISGLLILGTLVSLYALIQAGTASPYVLWLEESKTRSSLRNLYQPESLRGLSFHADLPGGRLHLGSGKERGWDGLGEVLRDQKSVVLLGVALMMAAILTTTSRGGCSPCWAP